MDFFFRFYDIVAKVSINAFIWDLVCWNWSSGFGDIRLCSFLGDTCRKKMFYLRLRKKFWEHIKKLDRFLLHSSRAFIWAIKELRRRRFLHGLGLGLGQSDSLGAPTRSHQKQKILEWNHCKDCMIKLQSKLQQIHWKIKN